MKNPQVNAILECVHGVLTNMMHSAELDVADSVDPSNIADFLTNTAWAIRSTDHSVLKASPGAAILGWELLLDIPFLAD